jgi:hypothetical protein
MYQVFELQRAAFDASVSKMVNEYEKKFVPQAEAISAYDVEIDERTKEIDNSISLIRELISNELSNCDLMDEVLNYLKIYDHSLVIDARNILNGVDVIIDLVEKDLDIINKTNYDEIDKDDTDNDKDRPTFIEKDKIDDTEADERHELIKDIIDPVAGEEGPLGSKGPVDTDAITEAIKEKNKEEAEAKQKAADEAKTEADIARQKAEEAKRRKQEAQEALKEAMDDLVHTMAEAKKLADAGATIGVVVSDTNMEVKPGASTIVYIKPDDLNNFITDEVIKEKINAAIEAAKDAIANGASHQEAVDAAAAAANKVDEAHSSIINTVSDLIHGRTQEYKEATSNVYGTTAVNYVENQIAAQEAAAEVPGAAQRLKEAQEALGEASAEARELQQAYEKAKEEADIRQAEADAAADSGAENSGGGEGNCDSSCDSTGCDEAGSSCDSNPGCDSCTRDGCKRDSCDGGCDCDRDPACGKDGVCGSDTCKRETDD